MDLEVDVHRLMGDDGFWAGFWTGRFWTGGFWTGGFWIGGRREWH